MVDIRAGSEILTFSAPFSFAEVLPRDATYLDVILSVFL
jgi:hypothetical protein